MDCERFDKLSLDLLYGELDELSSAAGRRHLHHCTRCQSIWAKLRATQELAQVPLLEPPDDLFESILRAEQEAHKRLPLRERVGRGISILAGYAMRPQLAMAALLLLMIGSGLIFWRTGPSSSNQVAVREQGEPSGDGSTDESRPRAFGEEGLLAELDMRKRAPAAASGATKGELPPTNRDAYAEAMSAYQDGRYAEAERLFSELSALGGEKAGSASLLEAHSARNGSGCQRAAALYDRVSARYAGSTVADEAAWQAAVCYQAMGQSERARKHFLALAAKDTYKTRAEKALEDLGPRPAEASAVAAATAAAPVLAAKSAAASKPAAEASSSEPAADATDEKSPEAPAAAAPAPVEEKPAP